MPNVFGLLLGGVDFAKDGRGVLAELHRKGRTQERFGGVTLTMEELGSEIINGALTGVSIAAGRLIRITKEKLDFAQGACVTRRTSTIVSLVVLDKSMQRVKSGGGRFLQKPRACTSVDTGHVTLDFRRSTLEQGASKQ